MSRNFRNFPVAFKREIRTSISPGASYITTNSPGELFLPRPAPKLDYTSPQSSLARTRHSRSWLSRAILLGSSSRGYICLHTRERDAPASLIFQRKVSAAGTIFLQFPRIRRARFHSAWQPRGGRPAKRASKGPGARATHSAGARRKPSTRERRHHNLGPGALLIDDSASRALVALPRRAPELRLYETERERLIRAWRGLRQFAGIRGSSAPL